MKSQVTPSNLGNHVLPTNTSNKTSKKNKDKGFNAPHLNPASSNALIEQFNKVNPLYRKYIAMILNPLDNEVIGLPDASSARTCLYRSIRSFPVYADFGASSSTARFSIAVQPKIGNLSSPSSFNVSMLNTVADDVDYTSPNSYVGYANGVDPRFDDNESILVGPKTGFWQLSVPLKGSVDPDLLQGTLSNLNMNLDVDILRDGNNILNTIRLPGGIYRTSYYVTTSGITTVSLPKTNATVVTGSPQGNPSSGSTGFIYYSEMLNIPGLSGSVSVSFQSIVNVTIIITVEPLSINTSTVTTQVTQNLGTCKKLRPVAASALFSYAGTTLRDGGMVSACLVPGDSLQDNFYTNNPINGGQYQLWENLARVPQSYNGPIREGSYTYWRPDSDLDTFLRTPDDVNNYSYPSIVISGQYTPGENLTGLVQVGRLSVTICYEWTTTSTLFEAYSRPGSHAVMDAITSSINGYPTSMSNPVHLEDIKRYLKHALDFIWKNRSALGTIATTAASLL